MRIALLAAGLAWLGCSSSLADSLTDAITRQSRQNFPEFLEMLSIPNVADRPEDIRQNAQFLERAFEKPRLRHAHARQSGRQAGGLRRIVLGSARSENHAPLHAFRRTAGRAGGLGAAAALSIRS